jgi:AraC-like DNA-binding protein
MEDQKSEIFALPLHKNRLKKIYPSSRKVRVVLVKLFLQGRRFMMSTQQRLTLDMLRKSPLTLWHCQDGMLCYLPPTACDDTTPPHFDDVFMLWFICQGRADLLIDGLCYPAPRGSLVWTSPQVLHRHRAAGCMEVILCTCSSALVQELWWQVDPTSQPPHVAVVPAPQLLATTMHRMVYEAKHPDPAQDHLLTLLFRLMLLDTFRLFVRTSSTTSLSLTISGIMPVTTNINTSIERALLLMHKEYQRDDLALATVADFAGLSLFHFTRLFKQETGITPGHYLRHQRLNHALHLLFDTRLSLDEVAYQSGLGSARRLSDLCQTAFGQTTTQLRKTGEQVMVLSELPAQKIVGNEQRNAV